ncbi:MAG: hypothetical protein JXQ29_16105 [Planctomycetes bacterium]|nr:hypothetical protein [Planctomycetota bacterium]
MIARYRPDRPEGIALIMVIVVLMALLLIATPFAVSMRDQRVTVHMIDSADRAQEDLVSIRDAVVGRLARTTHFRTDPTPDVDGLAEIEAAAALEAVGDLDGVCNPRGAIWSTSVEDEQAKINVNAASPFALANLFGARTVLSEKISDADTEIPVEDSSIFARDGGYVVVGAELIRYAGVQLGRLVGCERGVHAVEEEPIRLGVTESYYFSPGSIVRLSDGLRTDYAMISAVSRGFRTILSGRGGSVQITRGFTLPDNHGTGTPVLDARVFAVNLYRILRHPGQCYRYPTVTAIRQITDLGLPGFDPDALEKVLPLLTVYSQHEGAARWGNHRTVLDDFTYREREWLSYHTRIEFEVRYPVNINTADRPVLVALLLGLSGERQQEEVTADMAGKLADRILAARAEEPLRDAEDFLDRILEPALEVEEITRGLRGAVFQNFFDSPMLVFLNGGTHRAIFHALDTFTILANVSRNNAAGVELARRRMKEVVSVAPPQLIRYVLDSQWDFERLIPPGRYSRFVTTFPVNVETQQSPQDPPVFDPPNRSMKQLSGYVRNQRREARGLEKRDVFASRETEGFEGEDAGSVRGRPARSADGFGGMGRNVEPNRMFVEHFDNSEDIEGEKLTSGTRTLPLFSRSVSVQGGGRVSVRVSTGQRGGGMNPMVIGLWYRPLWDEIGEGRHYIWGTGDDPNTDKVELFYDGRERALVLEIADAGLSRPADLSRAYFPIQRGSRAWYHIACVIAGTRPDQMQILVDGVPFRGTEKVKQHYRFLTRLTGDISAEETRIPVEDSEGFPDRGVLLIGEEKIEYRGRSKTGFSAIADNRENPRVKRGRGSRGSTAVSHREGAAVLLYGYADAIASEIPAVQGRLAGAGGTAGLGRWRPALLNGKDAIVTVRGAPLGLLETSTSIPLFAPSGTLEGFQQSGYALLLSARIARLGPEPTPQNPNPAGTVDIGGVELVHYSTLAGNELQGVTRGVSTPHLLETFGEQSITWLNPTVPKAFLNGTEPHLLVQAESGQGVIPTWVVPISLQATDTTGYLDPLVTLYSERVQINTEGGRPEWVRYDELLTFGGAHYFGRTDWRHLRRLFRVMTRRALVPPASGKWAFLGLPGGGEGLAVAAPAAVGAFPDPEPPLPQQTEQEETFLGPVAATEVADSLPGWVEFRGSDDTQDRDHAHNIEILQVFRTDLPAAGPEDRVTLVDGSGATKEDHFVRWGAAYADASLGRLDRTAHFASFSRGVARRWLSDTERIRTQGGAGQRQRATVDRTPSAIQWDTRRVARLLKAPSGELPSRTTGSLIVGGTFGGRRASCILDEVETFPHTESTMRRIVAPPSLKLRYQNAINPGATQEEQQKQREAQQRARRYITADEVDIPLAYADVWTDFDGITREREVWRGSFAAFQRQNQQGRSGGSVRSPFPYTRRSADDRDCGLVRIGNEFIVYRGLEQQSERMEIVLKNCLRGAFGTEASAHEQGEAALFLGYVEMTLLREGISAEASSLPIVDSLGLAPQGYVAAFDNLQTGSVREVIGYTETRRGSRTEGTGAELVMPQRVSQEQLQTLIELREQQQEPSPEQGGSGIFRGRFGTVPAQHASNTVLLRLPFRYWDRAARNADNPELGYFQFPLNRTGAYVKTLTWGEHFRQKNLDLRVLARVDQRAPWDAEPRGRENGLFEFTNPRGQNDPNRIDMQGNLLEVRVFFEYRAGAFDALFDADGWKETPWLTHLRVDYVQASQVLYHEAKR